MKDRVEQKNEMISTTIKHYKILEKLGEGGMGVVYKADDTKLKRTVALKFLSAELTFDEKAKQRFVQEAQAASALDHPNICTIHEIDETDTGQMFIVMTYYEGKSLQEIVGAQNSVPLPLDDAINYAMQIAEGLARTHEAGIMHRDMKPANIMVTDRGEVKIVDFGLAKLAGHIGPTDIGNSLGTVAYLSPEQSEFEKTDKRADIWALGVILYEMLTGQKPFQGEADQVVLYSIVNEEPTAISELRPEVPEKLQLVVKKALAKDPDERYQYVDEMLGDLQRLKSDSNESRRTRKRNHRLYAIIAAILISPMMHRLSPRRA
ncbi:MAG: serine/threonine protein kinase, partial [bacterium]